VAVLPQLIIIFLGFFSIIFTFIAGSISWDFYLLSVMWIIWSMWTMSGICLAAIGKHLWAEDETFKEKKVPSFFVRAKELLVTVSLTICITLFFIMVDSSKINQCMNSYRLEILQLGGFGKHAAPIVKDTSIIIDVSEQDLKKAAVHSEKSVPGFKTKKEKEADVKMEQWVVNVFSERHQEHAKLYKKQLVAAGFPAYTIPAHVNGEVWIRVCVGFFINKEEAHKVSKRLHMQGVVPQGSYWISKVRVSEKQKELLLGN
jgi:hypothetical protein